MGTRFQARDPRIREAAKAFVGWTRFRADVRPAFGEMVHVWTIALRNAFTPRDDAWTAREAEYERWKEKVGPEGEATASKCLALLQIASNEKRGDHLGEMFQQIGAESKGLGQFFTPYAVSSFIARMSLAPDQVRAIVADKGFVDAMEPSCGAGGMVVAMGEAMAAAGLDPRRHLRVTAIDVDRLAVDMTFVQSTLQDVPCFVRCADALDPEAPSSYQFANVHLAAQRVLEEA